MGAARKIQSEIDRTLKKVQEGIDVFDEIWDKVYAPETSFNQKEKYEADLKKEIKKLQRYRDQIKTWLSSSDIKDKADLTKGRKDIERQMERFKVCEKEMKTKAFSKEGLGQSVKQDPRERARAEIRDWLNSTVDTLNLQVDEFESEVEGLANTGKRKNKPPPKLAHFEESIARHRQHILRLEQMLRLWDNESLSVEEIIEAREMVDDYLERNQDDFEEFASPDDIYEPLLDMLEGVADTQVFKLYGENKNMLEEEVAVSHSASVPAPKDKEKEREKERERAAAAAAKAQLAAHGQIRLEEDEKKTAPAAATGRTSGASAASRPASASVAVPSAVSDSSRGAPAVSPKASGNSLQRGLVALAAQEPSPPATQAQQQQPQPLLQQPQQLQQTGSAAPPSIQGFAVGQSPDSLASAPGPAATMSQPPSSWPFPTAAETLPDSKKRFLSQLQQIQQNGGAGSLDGLGLGGGGASGSVPASPQRSAPLYSRPTGGHQSLDGTGRPEEGGAGYEEQGKGLDGPTAPGGLLLGQLSNDLQRRGGEGGSPVSVAGPAHTIPPHVNPAASLQLLASCAARSIPQQQDSRWQTAPLRTRAPAGGVPASYPQEKLPILDNPALFEKLDSEALFFSFYYQPGSYQQYLAARELKRQSWRYHKQHGAWFQRHEEPKEATDEYEKGTYVYFDYNIMHDDAQSGWCYRLKTHFTFRYDALCEE